ncbi:alpha/beta hydrolase [candidate division KSB1 bacterium]
MKKLIILILTLTLMSCAYDDKDLVRVFYYESDALDTKIDFFAYIPQRADSPVPVVYFLNNLRESIDFTHDQINWQKQANQHSMIIVIISAGANIFRDNQGVNALDYEDFVLEIADIIDNTFLTRTDRHSRGISGVGTGGGGAISIANNNPDLFGYVSSLGANLNGYDLKNLESLSNLDILLSVGLQDINLEENSSLHEELETLEIDHIYHEQEGAGNWNYWKQIIGEHLQFHSDLFKNN